MFGFLACVAVYSKGYHACLNLDPTKEQNIIFKHWWNDVDSWIMFWVFNIQLNCFISIMDFCWNLLFPKYDDMSMSIDFFLYWKISSSSSSLLSSSSSSSQFSYHHYLHYYHHHNFLIIINHHHLHYYHHSHHHHHNFHFHTILRWIHVEKENCLHFHDITVCHNCLFITVYVYVYNN